MTVSKINMSNLPFSVQEVIYQGIEEFISGKWEDSILSFTKAIELDQKLPSIYYLRGKAYEKMGKKDDAINDIKKSAQLGDRDAQEYLKLRTIRW